MKVVYSVLALVVAVTFFSSPVHAENRFSDLDDSFWARGEVEFLAKQSIIGGFNDGSFRPNQSVTRAQAAMMLVKALDIRVENRPNPHFKDISKDHYAYAQIAAVADEGIFGGSHGSFIPGEPLKRGQMAAILDRAFKLKPHETQRVFRDMNPNDQFYRSVQNLAFNRVTTGYSRDRTFRPHESTTRAQFSVFLARLLDEAFKPEVEDDTEQIIVVTTKSGMSQQATLRTYERKNGQLRQAFQAMKAVVGYNGVGNNKREGDGQTPIGVFQLTEAFGTAPVPSGVAFPYRQTTKQDYWIDDPTSPDYNQWKTYSGDPRKKWKSFEEMYIDLYKYAIVMDYNRNPVVPGKGSAIFLHKWRSETSPTAGCVAVSEADLVKILKWLDPKKAPMIVIGLENEMPDF